MLEYIPYIFFRNHTFPQNQSTKGCFFRKNWKTVEPEKRKETEKRGNGGNRKTEEKRIKPEEDQQAEEEERTEILAKYTKYYKYIFFHH